MSRYEDLSVGKLRATHAVRFDQSLTVRGMPVGAEASGNAYWVDANSTARVDGTFQKPYTTLDAAIGACTANKGDVVYIKENHAETVTGVGGITADIAGITIIGLGNYNQRPRFLMDGAASVTLLVSAADVTVKNIVLAAGHEDIVRAIHVTAVGFGAIGVEFVENVATENFLIQIDATSASANGNDGLAVIGCRSIGVDASETEFIAVVEDLDGAVIRDNIVIKKGSTDGALIKQATGKDLTNLDCQWNFLQNAMTANDLFIDNDTTANSGFVAHNRCKHADVTTSHSLIDCDGVGLFDNLSTSVVTASGFILPAIDADS